MSDTVQVRCPHCRRLHVCSMLFVKDNLCPSCGRIYHSADLVLARPARRALYIPRTGAAAAAPARKRRRA